MPTHITAATSFLSEDEHKDERHDFTLERNDSITSLWKTKTSLYLVLITIFEAIIVIVLESVLFAKFKRSVPQDIASMLDEGLTRGIPVYLIIFIFSLIFQVALAWDAVHNKNTIQVIAFLLFNLCCFSYAVFQFRQIAEALDQKIQLVAGADSANIDVWSLEKLMIANPIVIGVCQLAYFYLGARLYLEFGWRIYKKIGADPDIRNYYRWYQIFLTIIKIDFFFFLGFSIQYLVLVLQRSDAEFALTIVALPLIFIFLFLAVYAIKHESKKLIVLFFLGLAIGVAYFIFKIVRIWDDSQKAKYQYVSEFLTFFACVTLILIILTTINAGICWSNFGKGLKSRLIGNSKLTRGNDHTNDIEADRTLSLD